MPAWLLVKTRTRQARTIQALIRNPLTLDSDEIEFFMLALLQRPSWLFSGPTEEFGEQVNKPLVCRSGVGQTFPILIYSEIAAMIIIELRIDAILIKNLEHVAYPR